MEEYSNVGIISNILDGLLEGSDTLHMQKAPESNVPVPDDHQLVESNQMLLKSMPSVQVIFQFFKTKLNWQNS